MDRICNTHYQYEIVRGKTQTNDVKICLGSVMSGIMSGSQTVWQTVPDVVYGGILSIYDAS